MSFDGLATFVMVSALLSLAPGPDNIFVLIQSALYGRKAGLLITLGLCTGLVVHTTLVALGVAAVFMVSTVAFTVLKSVGALYLLYLAVQALRASATKMGGLHSPVLSNRQLYLRGIVMNLSNPKVAIFFLAFLPQFAQPDAGRVSTQLFLLGLVFIGIALLVFGLIAVLAGQLAHWMQHSNRALLVMNRISALVFVALALRLAFSSR